MKRYQPLKTPLTVDEKNQKKDKKTSAKINQEVQRIEKAGKEALEGIQLKEKVKENLTVLQEVFKDCFDMIYREFTVGEEAVNAAVIYVEGSANEDSINQSILRAVMTYARMTPLNQQADVGNLMEILRSTSVSAGNIKQVDSMKEVVAQILNGKCILLLDGSQIALAINVAQWKSRSVSEPQVEASIRGPMEAFTESIGTNTVLIRKRIRTPDLKMEKYNIGRVSKTKVVITYIKGIADPKVVDEVKERVKRIDIDVILDSGYVEQLIEDSPYSPFPQIGNTERPDSTAAALAEGRVAILVDGTPFVLVVPTVFVHFLTATEDYYQKFYLSTFLRSLRYIAFAIALFAPSVYVAITSYHQEMIPAQLLISIAAARAEVPFPAVVEALMMELTFEILREASLRMPKNIGQAVNIVGALVIGEAAVQAGIVSQIMVIVVAITGIASFAVPGFNLAITARLIRFPIMVLAATFGLFGVIMGGLILLIHMTGLRSLGVPYLSPFVPVNFKDWKDSIFRAPLWLMRRRPSFIQQNNPVRMGKGLKPKQPPKDSP